MKNKSFCLLAFSCLHFLMAFSANTGTNVNTDKHVLLSLKSHLNLYPHHILSRNWSDSTSVCSWIGVTCNSRHQRVSAINISVMNITGNLPPQLGNLSFLVSLNLSRNNFHGSLPPEISQLRRLRVIDFTFNNLGGVIPSWVGLLSDLQLFYLRNNSFVGNIPTSLFNLSKLQDLELTFNLLAGEIPQEIGNLENLEAFSIQYNQITGFIPSGLFNISKVKSLAFTGNSLSGRIPDNICHGLPLLEELYLSVNNFHGEILRNISECSKIRIIALAYNQFTGHIPREIGKLRSLEMFYVSFNNFTGTLPEELGNITTLKGLSMENNKFAGSIPRAIFNISTLININLARTNVTGTLPIDMCTHLKQLEEVQLNENSLFGHIPMNLDECTALQTLVLALNKFQGYIPRNIGNLTMLQTLQIDMNRLEGRIPDEIGNLQNLEVISLSEDSLSGSIPTSLLNISTLSLIQLSGNQLTGNLASDFGDRLPNLEWIDISENNLTSESVELDFITSFNNCRFLRVLDVSENPLNGRLPLSIGNFYSLENFYAYSCGIYGSIPGVIGNLSNLLVLSLANNQLTGSFPDNLASMPSLNGLDLSNNNIDGTIPITLCESQRLFLLYLSENHLHDAIPNCIGNVTTLRTLDLTSNKLNSTIPTSLWYLNDILLLSLSSNFLIGSLSPTIGNLQVASRIDLSMNQLSGVIPSTIGNLRTVSGLSLAYNRLQGSIPGSIASMGNLEILNLSHNSLTGSIPISLEKLQYLEDFDVSYNSLSGEIPSQGPFKNFTSQSFLFNKGLCGDPRFHVPPCQKMTDESQKRKSKPRARVLALILSGTFAVVLIVVLAYVFARYRRKTMVSIEGSHHWDRKTLLRVSYHELLESTNGYAESNLLGSGSFGSVYIGTLKNGKDVAIKVFNLNTEGAFKSFDVECQVLKNLRHRNLCKVISSCSNQDFKALVLEYMPNGSLAKWLYSHNYFLDIIQRISIMIDIASALDYLHHGYSTPVIHCDLKPSNVLLDKHMVAHLSDFGIAKLLCDGETNVQTITLATFGYIAPEFGSEGIVSTSCDVYSFGIMLMEVFTRMKPNDETFGGDLSLVSLVRDSMSNSIIDHIIDSNLVSSDEEWSSEKMKCVSSIMELGLSCCMESPRERISITDATIALKKTKCELQTTKTNVRIKEQV